MNLLINRIMRNVFFYVLCLTFFSIAAMSCSDDDNFPRTGVDGRISSVKFPDNTFVVFHYNGAKIWQMKDSGGFVSDFSYTNNEPGKISYYPTDKRVADGNGAISFKRDGNKVRIENWGEPSFALYVKEIELDEHDIPVKITDVGIFENRGEGLEKVEDGIHYAVFTFDPVTRSLLKEEVYSIETSERVVTFTYEYEPTPGAMSNVDLPLWFFTYNIHKSYWEGGYNNLYFNYSENLIRKVIDDKQNNKHTDIRYTYAYNKAGFPVGMYTGESGFRISY